MKVRVYNDDEDFKTGGFRAVKKYKNELMKRPQRASEEKKKDEDRRRASHRPRATDWWDEQQ